MNRYCSVGLGALLLIAGCGDTAVRDAAIPSAVTNVVLLRVNGRDLTAQYVREKVELTYAKALAAQGRIMAAGNAKAMNAAAMMRFRQYVTDFLVEGDIEKKKIAVLPVDMSNALVRLNFKTHFKSSDIAQFKPAFSNRFDMLKREFDKDCQMMAYLRQEEGLEHPADEDINAYYVFIDQQQKRLDAVGAKQWARAHEAEKALKDGLSWTNAVERFSEDKLDNRAEYGFDWGTWALDTIPFPEMGKRIVSLEVGGTSEPFETEDGIIILCLMNKPEEHRYHLGRILIRLPEAVSRPSRDEVRGILVEDNFKSAMNSAKKRLQKGVRFEYPLGTNFAYKIWQEQPKKARKASDKRTRMPVL